MQAKAFFQSLAAIVLWSFLAWLAVQLSKIPPFLLVGLALSIGSLCSIHKINLWRVSMPTLLLGIYGFFGFHFCLFMALRHAPPVEANLINYLWPLLIVVLTPLFLPNYHLTVRHLVAAVLGFFGAALIVTGGKLNFQFEYLTGYFLAGVSAFIWASYSLLTKRVPSFPNEAIGLFCLSAGVLSLVIHFFLEDSYSMSSDELLVLLMLGVGPMGAAFFFWDAALKNGDPRIIGSLAYLTPLFSTAVLISTGSGTFTLISAIAMVLIVGGAMIGTVTQFPQLSKSGKESIDTLATNRESR